MTIPRQPPLVELPVGRKVPRGRLRWYFVSTFEGDEERACESVRSILRGELLHDAFVPRVEVGTGSGPRHAVARSLFRGFFIAATTDAPALAKELSKLSIRAHMAGAVGRGFTPMSEDAQALLEATMDRNHVIRKSVGTLAGTRLRVTSGPLVGFENRITQVDRRRRLACVRVGSPEGRNGFDLLLPLELPERPDAITGPHASPSQGVPVGTALSIPFGRRTTAGDLRWYLASYPTGQGDDIAVQLRESLPRDVLQDAFVPRQECQRKHGGAWVTSQIDLFQGHLVLAAASGPKLAAALRSKAPQLRMAGGASGSYAPVDEIARRSVERLMDDEHVVRLSWGEIIDDRLHVSSGPLVGYDEHILGFNRRNCVADVRLQGSERDFVLRLPVAITARRCTKDESSTGSLA